MSRGARKNQSNEGIEFDRLEREYGPRYARLMTDLEATKEAIKDLLTEMKSTGFDTKHFKNAMKVKEIGYDDYRADDDEFQLYLRGVGAVPKHETDPLY